MLVSFSDIKSIDTSNLTVLYVGHLRINANIGRQENENENTI